MEDVRLCFVDSAALAAGVATPLVDWAFASSVAVAPQASGVVAKGATPTGWAQGIYSEARKGEVGPQCVAGVNAAGEAEAEATLLVLVGVVLEAEACAVLEAAGAKGDAEAGAIRVLKEGERMDHRVGVAHWAREGACRVEEGTTVADLVARVCAAMEDGAEDAAEAAWVALGAEGATGVVCADETAAGATAAIAGSTGAARAAATANLESEERMAAVCETTQ